MEKPRILDLFCGAGGSARGYQDAGFYVVGVDHKPQPNYAGDEFVQADALDVLRWLTGDWHEPAIPGWLRLEGGFDAIHASPPCQAYAQVAQGRKKSDHPDLVGPTRELLRATGLPWVIENVTNAPMPDSFVLCGSTFGLPIIRHRRFEVDPPIGLVPSACHQRKHGRGVDHGPGFYPYGRKTWEPAWREHVLPVVWPWMTLEEAGQAVPPAYTEFIGAHLLTPLQAERAVREAAA